MARNRIWSIATVSAAILVGRASSSGGSGDDHTLILVTMAIGVGHMVGAAWSDRDRYLEQIAPGTSPLLLGSVVVVTVVNLFQGYAWVLSHVGLRTGALTLLFLVGAWHVVESEVRLREAYSSGCLRLDAARRRARSYLGVGIAAVATGTALAACTPTGAHYGRLWLGLELETVELLRLDEVLAGVLLYHVATWARFFWDRSRLTAASRPRAAKRMRRWLVAGHLLPAAAGVLLAGALTPDQVYGTVTAIYLFASALHTLQTSVSGAVSGGLPPRAPTP